MTRDEIVSIIRDEVRRSLPVILAALTEATTDNGRETISNIYSGQGQISNRPVMHPYGLRSRAPKGSTAVTATQGTGPSNRIILGHRDEQAPAVDGDNDVMLYSAHGNEIYLKGGTVAIGSRNASKGAARNGDSVQIDSGATISGTITGANPGPVISGTAVTILLAAPLLPGKITSGSGSVTIAD